MSDARPPLFLFSCLSGVWLLVYVCSDPRDGRFFLAIQAIVAGTAGQTKGREVKEQRNTGFFLLFVPRLVWCQLYTVMGSVHTCPGKRACALKRRRQTWPAKMWLKEKKTVEHWMISTVTLFFLSPTVNMVFRVYVSARDTIGPVALCVCSVGNGCASVVFLVFSGSKMYFMLTLGVLPNHETRYKGTRLDGEKDFYETYFGGGTRGQNVMVSSGDEGNAATPLGLQAMQEVGCEKRPTYLRTTDLVRTSGAYSG